MKSSSTGHIALAVFKPDLELLRRQLESLAAQSVTDWTCEIGIDGPDAPARDEILTIIDGDPRFTVSMFTERVGFYRNFERLLTRVPVSAQWIALSDQDDLWFPQKLELLVPSLASASLVVGEANVVARDHVGPALEQTSRRIGTLASTMIDNQVTGSLAVFRSDLLELALPFPPATDVAYHDHWLGVCALVSHGVESVPEIVQDYVQHDSNVIGEETGRGIGPRIAALNGKGKSSIGHKLDYISEHRWGWRVNMATSVLNSGETLADHDRSVLEQYSAGRFSGGLFRSVTAQILRRQVPALRASALLVGSARAPRKQTARDK